jgi:hypothetical protein
MTAPSAGRKPALSGVSKATPSDASKPRPGGVSLTDVERGLVAGVLIGEGHFGGDGRQPQVTLRMHVRHESLFRWLQARFPRSRLYGPYSHGGREYYQWMARGAALAEDVLPVVEGVLNDEIDAHVAARVAAMRESYKDFFARYER